MMLCFLASASARFAASLRSDAALGRTAATQSVNSLQQHLYWCNDYTIPVDYVDPLGHQPCCFETFCKNSLNGVVKSYDVECFNDTSCRSGKYCSSEGICVDKGTPSNCSSHPLQKPSSALYWLMALFGGAVLIRRRKGF